MRLWKGLHKAFKRCIVIYGKSYFKKSRTLGSALSGPPNPSPRAANATNCRRIRQNYSTEAGAAIDRLGNLHPRASCTYLSLRFHCHRRDVALGGLGHRRHEQAEEKREDARQSLEDAKPAGGRALSQDLQKKPGQDERGETEYHGSRHGHGEDPEAGPGFCQEVISVTSGRAAS